MDFLKYYIFNFLLLVSQVYCQAGAAPKLSCGSRPNEKGSNFRLKVYIASALDNKNHRIKTLNENKLKEFLKNRFNDDALTVVLIHGFLADHHTDWVELVREKFIQQLHANVILLDWSNAFYDKDPQESTDYITEAVEAVEDGIDYVFGDEDDDDDDDTIIPTKHNSLNYKDAALQTEIAARKLSKILIGISKTRSSPNSFLKDLYIIGHSLGAHLAGQTARRVEKLSGVKIARVTGLDPAYPCFKPKANPTLKLRKTDARLVDVIHTNSEPGVNDNLGTYEPLGHLDFYPNRGGRQPKCNLDAETRTIDIEDEINEFLVDTLNSVTRSVVGVKAAGILLKYGGERFDILCEHGQAAEFYNQSFTKAFYSVPTILPIRRKSVDRLNVRVKNCPTFECVNMGYFAFEYASKPGIYYTDTTI